MQEVCDRLHDDYGWSDSVSNFSNKLRRESLRFREIVELADVLGYDIEWVPKETNRFLGRGGAAERTRVRVYADASDTELATTRQKSLQIKSQEEIAEKCEAHAG
jgi:hypothetical protein